MTIRKENRMPAVGRYVEVYIAATMHSLKLCKGIAVFAAMAGALEGSAAHSF